MRSSGDSPGEPHLVVCVVDGEVAHADDDLMQQLLGGVLGAVPKKGADDVAESQRQALSSQDRLEDNTHTLVMCIHQVQSASLYKLKRLKCEYSFDNDNFFILKDNKKEKKENKLQIMKERVQLFLILKPF